MSLPLSLPRAKSCRIRFVFIFCHPKPKCAIKSLRFTNKEANFYTELLPNFAEIKGGNIHCAGAFHGYAPNLSRRYPRRVLSLRCPYEVGRGFSDFWNSFSDFWKGISDFIKCFFFVAKSNGPMPPKSMGLFKTWKVFMPVWTKSAPKTS